MVGWCGCRAVLVLFAVWVSSWGVLRCAGLLLGCRVMRVHCGIVLWGSSVVSHYVGFLSVLHYAGSLWVALWGSSVVSHYAGSLVVSHYAGSLVGACCVSLGRVVVIAVGGHLWRLAGYGGGASWVLSAFHAGGQRCMGSACYSVIGEPGCSRAREGAQLPVQCICFARPSLPGCG
jgi:hypothetical protein